MISLRKKPRVLLLDDDPSMQRLIAALLRRDGYRVDIVSAGGAAIEKLGRFEYDAMLLDIMTPTEGGMTVIRHLRENNPTLRKRVILVTGSPSSVLHAVSKEVFAIVKKPFDAEELLSTVRRLVDPT
jgi:DNA-binding response OmpR family regulator